MKNWILKKRSIWFHIILTYFTCGIWAIVYFYCKYTNKDKVELYMHQTNYSPFTNNNFEILSKIEKKYSNVLHKHYQNIEKINMLYTVINNLALPNNPEMQKVINLCLEDIDLAPEILNYCKEKADYYNDDLEKHLINYETFQRLAIIYEKQKEYEKAIDICKYAIEVRFYKDGTSGQMPGRLARLIKKSRQENLKINEK